MRDGIQDLGHTVADVVLEDVAHIATRHQDAHHRPKEVEVVGTLVERVGQQSLKKVYQLLEYQRSRSTTQTCEQCQDQHQLLFREVLLAPVA